MLPALAEMIVATLSWTVLVPVEANHPISTHLDNTRLRASGTESVNRDWFFSGAFFVDRSRLGGVGGGSIEPLQFVEKRSERLASFRLRLSWFFILNAQSTTEVVSGKNWIHPVTSQSVIHHFVTQSIAKVMTGQNSVHPITGERLIDYFVTRSQWRHQGKTQYIFVWLTILSPDHEGDIRAKLNTPLSDWLFRHPITKATSVKIRFIFVWLTISSSDHKGHIKSKLDTSLTISSSDHKGQIRENSMHLCLNDYFVTQ